VADFEPDIRGHKLKKIKSMIFLFRNRNCPSRLREGCRLERMRNKITALEPVGRRSLANHPKSIVSLLFTSGRPANHEAGTIRSANLPARSFSGPCRLNVGLGIFIATATHPMTLPITETLWPLCLCGKSIPSVASFPTVPPIHLSWKSANP
jgi:hypothetical protein